MVRVVASSVRGPAHAQEGLPCQDAWKADTGSRASFAVVCDGMGSRPRAQVGARAATLAARDAWRLWRRSAAGTVEDLIRLLEAAWRIRLGEILPDSAATTCLVYAEDEHGRAALLQLGDGLMARRTRDGAVIVHPAGCAREFGATLALGTPHALADWSWNLTAPLARGEALVMATDGVADDLDHRRLGELAAWIMDEFGALPHPGRALALELRGWPVPHHLDDKTLLVMWKPCNSPSDK